ncbi:MAG: tRNA (adenosine(37)-N6)-dimethylallyltransferase MiaA [Prevotella sp.]|nr:tRNA (adenosine(37)-N6)-dimethylallyltransferase MiaA [Prevotella sp.]
MQQFVTILGPTASGKTSLAVALSSEIGAEIISADSRQVYRGMDIGTGKDLKEYVVNGKTVAYHLINIAEPGTKYNVFEYQRDFLAVYEDIKRRNVMPVLCGGTGLYIEAVLKGYKLVEVPENRELREEMADKTLSELTDILVKLKQENGTNMHNTTDVDTAKRAIRAIEIETYYKQHPDIVEREMPKIDSLIIGVDINRDERRRKISKRLKDRLEEGMVDEVKGLLDRGIRAEDLIYYGLEYKYVTKYIIGELTYDEMFHSLETAIHQFAKRQMTWFRGMERRGFKINWIDATLPIQEKVKSIKEMIYN